MNRTIAIIGGDARYLELIRQLQALTDTTLLLIGFDKLEQGFTGLKQMDIDDVTPSSLDAIILPITGTNSDGKVEPVFSEKPIYLSLDWFKQLRKSAIVFSGIANDYLTDAVNSANAKLIPLLDRDDVAIYNSIPTAEGTIMMAIEHTDFTIHSSRVVVVGFGRVGNTVANKFSALGAKVSVSATRMKDLARVTEMGLTAIPLDQLASYMENCDLLINTIPAPVIGKEEMKHLPSHAVIIDLASKPGGTDFAYAKQRGIKAILSRSLPSIVAPKTAGKILADVIKQEFLKQGETK
ncbi:MULTISPECIES: dipicolinic acid synthetase subunit A [Virgibacillus]|uniref:Dipicolinate synthase subunit A n=1 Tax=Virgibacillus pantothenticus TaxID=1473 RepID=A0A0L0QNV1_VIRPA|nr:MULTISPECIES: dipicolinic acid synthetase subunit A [Virgibacillus]API93935.1 dipicolinic acid synthetase subunit A [Virgibacillus sp. 6R]KNE20219.1 dipicolinate synthase subunit A [Virgibacillus pantothenticus]MBS7427520.1 dipicolinic acid synthetase subunit A [Virgibacillus sp. 19R1-5]MBU8565990.1 dipicolinic acid synthetase subunit A [Virgibacillus pantothenticus]MBU8600967.1 dipicolinic acid synthetase subunit A [Virgibacillus pantothenticus]